MHAVWWIGKDLRLLDNEALHAASQGRSMTALFVLPNSPGSASRAWLHHSLVALAKDLTARGQRLVVLKGPVEAALDELSAQLGPLDVHVLESSDPLFEQELRAARVHCMRRQHAFSVHGSPWLLDPALAANKQGQPYKVFTPFWRHARPLLQLPSSLPVPRLPPPAPAVGLLPTDWRLLPAPRWDKSFWNLFEPGEKGALEALDTFEQGALHGYATGRDRLDQTGTSLLSPHLAWGEISVHRAARLALSAAALRPALVADCEKFLSELGWREFCRHLFVSRPCLGTEDFASNGVRWETIDPALRAAFERGQTGVPIIDAAMRQLWQTGWMHNRARMIVADFWCKHLGYDWRAGAAWFWDTLVDADWANNSLGWQWAAGTGADAAPYFRVFSPQLQAEKFDPTGRYRRQFLPELAAIALKQLSSPPPVLGYPQNVLPPTVGRARALTAWKNRVV